MSTLSRDQVEQFLRLATLDRAIVNVDGWIGVYSALRLMIYHDAAQRDQLAVMTEERDTWRTQYESCHVLHLEAQAECEEKNTFMLKVRAIDAEQQLTASQSRCAQLEEVLLSILHADERGQGLPFKEAMDRAYKLLAHTEGPPASRRSEA